MKGMIPTMDDAIPRREELEEVIQLVSREASIYLRGLDQRPARSQGFQEALEAFNEPLPKSGLGAARTLSLLINEGLAASVATAGPRSFHFVIGGTTPLPWARTGGFRRWIRWSMPGLLRHWPRN
jgi:hypothetical protein